MRRGRARRRLVEQGGGARDLMKRLAVLEVNINNEAPRPESRMEGNKIEGEALGNTYTNKCMVLKIDLGNEVNRGISDH